jgi:small-conductance mechanosensitive channel
MEELALENDTLKAVIDKQAKRIQMWELNSQNSFNALAQSFRARGPGRNNNNNTSTSDATALAHALAAQGITTAIPSLPIIPPQTPHQQHPSPTPPSPDTDAAKRIADLEALLASQTAKVDDLMTNNERLAKQNERNTQVLARYREQWEKLKAGARKKEQERRERKGTEGRFGESEVGEGEGEGEGEGVAEEALVEEPGFGKA